MYRPYYVRACAQHFISSLSEATDCGRVAELQHEDALIVDFRFIESNRSSRKKPIVLAERRRVHRVVVKGILLLHRKGVRDRRVDFSQTNRTIVRVVQQRHRPRRADRLKCKAI